MQAVAAARVLPELTAHGCSGHHQAEVRGVTGLRGEGAEGAGPASAQVPGLTVLSQSQVSCHNLCDSLLQWVASLLQGARPCATQRICLCGGLFTARRVMSVICLFPESDGAR